MSKIKSYTSASGTKTTHYDENGNKVGESWKSPGGQITHYDANGNKTGTSFTNKYGRMSHYDNNWNKTGNSQVIHSGQVRHYDNDWNKTGETNKSFYGGRVTENNVRPSVHHAASSPGCVTILLLGAVTGLMIGLLI